MIERSFLDTNLLVYVFDDDCPEKQARAQSLTREAMATGLGRISTQVLMEFYVASTRKLKRPLSHADAELAVTGFATLPVVCVDERSVRTAVARAGRHSLSLWDSMIVQAAVESGCRTLLTEDMQHGREIHGVRVQNPFQG